MTPRPGDVVRQDEVVSQTFLAEFRHADGSVTMFDNGHLTVYCPGPNGLEVSTSTRGHGHCQVSAWPSTSPHAFPNPPK